MTYLVFLTQRDKMLGTQGTCACAVGGGSHCNLFVHMKSLLQPVAGERASEGCAELHTRELGERATAVQRTREGDGEMQKLLFPALLCTSNWRK